MVPIKRVLRITSVRSTSATSNENVYLECDTDAGVVAFWGQASNMRNIQCIKGLTTPVEVYCGTIDGKFSQHRLWVPEGEAIFVRHT